MSTKTKLSPLTIIFVGSLAFAGQPEQTGGGSKLDRDTNATHQDKAQKLDGDSTKAGADNTAINERDKTATERTANQQKNNQSDVELTAKIRRSIVSDKSLSTNAHNIKIIAQNGVVTLKGPVHSEAEKGIIEQKASAVAGHSNVKNEIDVKP
jgi:hyperosmotically inducible periplasmic protein